jgi:hypothetical protein
VCRFSYVFFRPVPLCLGVVIRRWFQPVFVGGENGFVQWDKLFRGRPGRRNLFTRSRPQSGMLTGEIWTSLLRERTGGARRHVSIIGGQADDDRALGEPPSGFFARLASPMPLVGTKRSRWCSHRMSFVGGKAKQLLGMSISHFDPQATWKRLPCQWQSLAGQESCQTSHYRTLKSYCRTSLLPIADC